MDYSCIDMTYRPDTYWTDFPTVDEMLSRIQGRARQDIAKKIMKEKGFTALTEFFVQEQLDDRERVTWSSIHPGLMGGEFLPVLLDGEVEIARISLESVTADQESIRAQRRAKNIYYRVVDEYEQDYKVKIKRSKLPLSFEELVQLIDSAGHELTQPAGGLVIGQWEQQYEWGLGAEEAIEFLSIQSPFYPDLNTYYGGLAIEWEEKKVAQEEKEEEDDV